MDLPTFRVSLAEAQPPAGSSPALQALWWDAKGHWDKAHERAQERDDAAGAAAQRRRTVAPSILTLDEEWQDLAESPL